jgi:hypothetical protein
MIRKKAEPWQREDVEAFLRLLERYIESERKIHYSLSGLQVADATMVRLSDLLSLASPEEKANARIEKGWAEIRAHSVYQWLDKQPAFCASWKFFQRARAKAKPHRKMAASDAPFVYLHIVVEWASILHDVKKLAPNLEKKRGPTSSRRKFAIRHAQTLIQLSDEGVQLSGIDGLQLRRLLIKFIREVEGVKRKRRADKNSTMRDVLEHAAYLLLTKLELTYPSILANLAALANVECPIKNAQRYFAVARRKHQENLRKSLVDALGFKVAPDS